MKAFKHELTGRIVEMPDHIGEMFNYLTPVDPSEQFCIECKMDKPATDEVVSPVADETETQVTDEVEGN